MHVAGPIIATDYCNGAAVSCGLPEVIRSEQLHRNGYVPIWRGDPAWERRSTGIAMRSGYPQMENTDAKPPAARALAAMSPALDPSIEIVVCIPCFRRPHYLRQTLESLAQQRTDRRFAVVMVENDASRSESVPVASSFLAAGDFPASAWSNRARAIATRSMPRSRRRWRCFRTRPVS